MKCIVLAGGKGGGLWPLSRKNYPIQFAEIRDKHSAFQEIIARHLPYCDQFYIFTNSDYRYIAEGQLEIFQELKYKLFLEEESVNTALPVVLASMLSKDDGKMLVVGCNAVYDGEGFRENFSRAVELADSYPCVLMGMPFEKYASNVGYIKENQSKVEQFVEKPDKQLFEMLGIDGSWLCNTGKYLINPRLFIDTVKERFGKFYDRSKLLYDEIMPKLSQKTIELGFTGKELSVSFERGILSHIDSLGAVRLGNIEWNVIADFDSVKAIIKQDAFENVVEMDCKDITVINFTENQLVVANGIDNAVIVNTGDTVYIEGRSAKKDVKDFFVNHESRYVDFIDDTAVKYRPWGRYTVKSRRQGYAVKEVVVYPHKEMTMHKHEYRSEHWSIVEGMAEITVDGKTAVYGENTSVFVPQNSYHKIANNTDKNVIIIEVEIGKIISESDIDRQIVGEKEIIKLAPAFKDYLWGGTRLRDEYGKKCSLDIIAESWELSTHPDGNSVISTGVHRGMPFGEYIKKYGESVVGWKCKAFSKFPMLIKLIDSKQALSVQVHPDDTFALANEDQYGKNEMWYVVDCDKDSFIYCGFKKNITKEEFYQRLENNTVEEVLNKIPVSKGDAFFIPSGTVHAIGGGILICEIQQSSNCTYRIYDYNRRDKNGNKRELHIDKAVRVLNMEKYELDSNERPEISDMDGNLKKELCACKYFRVEAVKVNGKYDLVVDNSSFAAVVAVVGSGELVCGKQRISLGAGETAFLPAGCGNVSINGNCEIVISNI